MMDVRKELDELLEAAQGMINQYPAETPEDVRYVEAFNALKAKYDKQVAMEDYVRIRYKLGKGPHY